MEYEISCPFLKEIEMAHTYFANEVPETSRSGDENVDTPLKHTLLLLRRHSTNDRADADPRRASRLGCRGRVVTLTLTLVLAHDLGDDERGVDGLLEVLGDLEGELTRRGENKRLEGPLGLDAGLGRRRGREREAVREEGETVRERLSGTLEKITSSQFEKRNERASEELTVSATPTTSRPLRPSGSAAAWIGEGLWKPRLKSERLTSE